MVKEKIHISRKKSNSMENNLFCTGQSFCYGFINVKNNLPLQRDGAKGLFQIAVALPMKCDPNLFAVLVSKGGA